jgi:hypothetical protein
VEPGGFNEWTGKCQRGALELERNVGKGRKEWRLFAEVTTRKGTW